MYQQNASFSLAFFADHIRYLLTLFVGLIVSFRYQTQFLPTRYQTQFAAILANLLLKRQL